MVSLYRLTRTFTTRERCPHGMNADSVDPVKVRTHGCFSLQLEVEKGSRVVKVHRFNLLCIHYQAVVYAEPLSLQMFLLQHVATAAQVEADSDMSLSSLHSLSLFARLRFLVAPVRLGRLVPINVHNKETTINIQYNT